LLGRKDDVGSGEEGVGGGSRIVVQPASPFEQPRRAPVAFVERFDERKEKLKKSKEGSESTVEGEEQPEGERQEVIGVDVITDEDGGSDGGNVGIGAAR
jgi:hypothetical protein